VKENTKSVEADTAPIEKQDTVRVEKSDTLNRVQLIHDTLFSDYYYGMSSKEINYASKQYYFVKDKDFMQFKVRFKFLENKLKEVILNRSESANHKGFDFILNLYKDKYGEFVFTSKTYSQLYMSTYRIKHFY